MTAFPDVGGRPLDGVGDLPVQTPELGVDRRGRLLDQGHRRDEARGHGQAAHRKILHRPLGLGLVEGIGGYLQGPQRVGFLPVAFVVGHGTHLAAL